MDSKITVEGNVVVDDNAHGRAFKFENNNQRIKSDIMFEKTYTFFLIGQKTKKENIGTLFSSNLDNRAFGWDSVNIIFKLDNFCASVVTKLDSSLHCFIVRNDNTNIDYWDFDEKINIYTLTAGDTSHVIDSSQFKQSMICLFNFGKIVIGYPTDNKILNEKSYGLIYEVIAFDKALSDENIQTIKNFLKKYYPALTSNQSVNNNQSVKNDQGKKATKKSNVANSYL